MADDDYRPGSDARPARKEGVRAAVRARGVRARWVRALLLVATTIAALSGVPRSAGAAEPAAKERTSAVSAELVLRALSMLGVNYRFGGTSPEAGLDCSGLVLHVFREAAGLSLPRRSEEMSRIGEPVNTTQLRPGDLVFFNTLRRAFSHVGIYIGDRRFVHSPSSGGSVSIETIDGSYWKRRFNGARRLLASEDSPIDAGSAGRMARHSPASAVSTNPGPDGPPASPQAPAAAASAATAASASDRPSIDTRLYQN